MAAALPSGTVTFLFTDIEGSTRLLGELGDEAYAGALSAHRRVLRAALVANGGAEVETQGDGFFFAFDRAKDALAAATAARDALAGPVRVRMGLHTGEPLRVDDGYVGIDVHRAARIAAAGHGGQILVSQSTRDLVKQGSFRDLGEHRLKDLTRPERIWQVGDTEFPPLKSLNSSNLPVAASPLLGRIVELAEVIDLLTRDVRVVTITGAGGSGKTRLALQAAAEMTHAFRDGVSWVPVAGLRDAELVVPTVVQRAGARSIDELRAMHVLILVDNLEHLLDAAPALSDLLASAPELRLLVTSRAPLRIAGEHEYPLAPLATNDAAAFFVERARAAGRVVGADEVTREICRRLDNLPLALELAAARTKVLSASALLARLERRLPLLTAGARDAPERQQTLRATIDWSFNLLPIDARGAFSRLGIFAGSFGVEGAEDVAGVTFDELAALVDLNLVRSIDQGRFLLFETIREYALERLDATGDSDGLRRRLVSHYAAVAAELKPSVAWHLDVARFAAEQDNLRNALEYATAHDVDAALSIVNGIGMYWLVRGELEEGLRWASSVVAAAAARDPSAAYADALALTGEFQRFLGQATAGITSKERALERYRALGDERGVAATLHDLADTWSSIGEFERARTLVDEGLAIRRRIGEPEGISHALSSLVDIELLTGDPAAALAVSDEVVALHRLGAAEPDFVVALGSRAECRRRLGDAENARLDLREAIGFAQRYEGLFFVSELLAIGASLARDGERAARLLAASDGIRATTGFAVWDPAEQERRRRSIFETLPPAALEAARVKGAALSVEDALSLALDSLD